MKQPLALALLFTASFPIATPAQAEIVSQSDTGFAVVHEKEVSTDPDTTYAMLRTPARWWAKEHSWSGNADNFYMDASAGGCFCEQLPQPEGQSELKRGSVEHARIIYAQPGKLLRLSGAFGPLQGEAVTGTLSIALTPSTKGTIIRFEYVVGGYMRFPVKDIAPGVDTVIGQQLSRLSIALGPVVRAQGAPVTAPVPLKPEPVKPAPVAAPKPAVKPIVPPPTQPKTTPAPSVAKPLPPGYVPSKPAPGVAKVPIQKPDAQPGAKPDFGKLILEGLDDEAGAAKPDVKPPPEAATKPK